ncbi:MAG: hypothetical protein E7642_06235 [Ruminococcaceae bacterium]|nr:hypothetical protein [Oscillospiraceae bacterium]
MKKKIISFMCLSALCALLICGCSENVDLDETDGVIGTEATEKATEKQTEKATDSKKPSTDDNDIKNINGKTPRECFEAFLADYSSATDFDIKIENTTYIDETQSYKESYNLKLSGEELYMLQTGETRMEVWYVDGMLYVQAGAERVKAETDIEEYFGADLVEMLTSSITDELHDVYLRKLDAARIHKTGGGYYVQIDISAQEAVQMDRGEEAFSDQIVFDETGKVTAIFSSYEQYILRVTFNSLGEPVEISAPENADDFEYVYMGTEKDPEAYESFVQLCNTLKNAEKYKCEIYFDGKPRHVYQFDGENKYWVKGGSPGSERWLVDNKAYYLTDHWIYTGEEATKDFLNGFDEIDNTLYYASLIVDIEDMEYVISYEDKNGNNVVELAYYYDDGEWRDVYTYTFDPTAQTEIMINILSFQNGILTGEIDYCFTDINSDSLEIEAPNL